MGLDQNILMRYLEGNWTEDDGLKIREWFNNLNDERELRASSKDYWNELQPDSKLEDYDETALLGQIYRQIRLNEFRTSRRQTSSHRILNIITKIAAVLFIPMLIVMISSHYDTKIKASDITYNEIYSPPGSRTMFTLPDGSKGWLNSGSYLKYPQTFLGKTRTVSLKGEAYFNVVTNPDKPFVVSGKSLSIVAKGTAFNVTSWEDEPGTKVTLVHGKVEVYKDYKEKNSLIASLKPNQMLFYSPTGSGSYIKDVDINKYISWTDGKLVFRDDPFTEVVKKISRWYNVNIIVEDNSLKSYTYVATFQDESLDEVLKMLKISAPIDYKSIARKQRTDGSFEKKTIEIYYKAK